MRVAFLLALAFTGAAAGQCPPAPPPQVRVTVVHVNPPPAPVGELVPVWIVPSQKAYQLYAPAAAPPASRVEYRYGPFGGLRRVVVRP